MTEKEKCEHKIAIGSEFTDTAFSCMKCSKEWTLKEHDEEIRQRSELKGFNEGIDEAITKSKEITSEHNSWHLDHNCNEKNECANVIGKDIEVALQNLKTTRNGSE